MATIIQKTVTCGKGEMISSNTPFRSSVMPASSTNLVLLGLVKQQII